MNLSDSESQVGKLRRAAQDLRFLLERGYPREKVLSLVGDRHGLRAGEREFLRRGVCAPRLAAARKERRLGLTDVAGLPVAVDGHNQLITLETALRGDGLILADDGWVRDISRLGRNHRPDETTRLAAGLMLSALADVRVREVLIYLDAPLPKSGELAGWLRSEMAALSLSGKVQALPVPEKRLFIHQGPVASSDSAVIDRVEAPLDLAGGIVMQMEPAPKLERFLDETG